MEHKIDNDFNNDDSDDALSLRDLQMYDQTATSSTCSSPRTSSGQQLFEFFPTLSSDPTATGDIIFYGKVIPNSVYQGDDEDLNDQYQKRDYRRVVGSSSCRLPERPIEHASPLRSVSNRGISSPRFSTSVKKVKTTSMNSKSKRRMFMFGLVKFMPEMEMRSIRERQLRRAPSRMFPVADGGDDRKAVAGGGAHRNTVSCRARLNSVFERSVACPTKLTKHLVWKFR